MIRDDDRAALIIYDVILAERQRYSISESVKTEEQEINSNYRRLDYCLYKDRIYITKNDDKNQLQILIDMSVAKAIQHKLEELGWLKMPS